MINTTNTRRMPSGNVSSVMDIFLSRAPWYTEFLQYQLKPWLVQIKEVQLDITVVLIFHLMFLSKCTGILQLLLLTFLYFARWQENSQDYGTITLTGLWNNYPHRIMEQLPSQDYGTITLTGLWNNYPHRIMEQLPSHDYGITGLWNNYPHRIMESQDYGTIPPLRIFHNYLLLLANCLLLTGSIYLHSS